MSAFASSTSTNPFSTPSSSSFSSPLSSAPSSPPNPFCLSSEQVLALYVIRQQELREQFWARRYASQQQRDWLRHVELVNRWKAYRKHLEVVEMEWEEAQPEWLAVDYESSWRKEGLREGFWCEAELDYIE